MSYRLASRRSVVVLSFWFWVLMGLEAARVFAPQLPPETGFEDGPKARCIVIINGVQQEVECD